MKNKGLDKKYLISLVLSIAIALAIGGVLIASMGYSPLEGYGAMIHGVFGNSRVLGNTIAKSLTLMLTGLAMAIAAKAGMFNVGGEGQLFLGGLAATMTAVFMAGTSPVIVIPASVLAAIVFGGGLAYIPAVLKVKLNVSEVITTIMLNSAVISLCAYLSNGPFKDNSSGSVSGTASIDMYKFMKLIPASNLTTALFYSAGMAVAVWYIMTKTSTGLEMKLTGENPRFAFYSGIKKDSLMIKSMVASGAICGLVGMFEVYGIHGRFTDNISNEFYFDGMLLAMIMNYNPVGIILMSFFFGILKIGAYAMELSTGIPGEISQIIFAIIIFLMLPQKC